MRSSVSSKTELTACQALQVPELWIDYGDQLTINVLRQGRYIDSETSPTRHNIAAVREIIPQYVQGAREVGASQTLEEFE